MKLEDRIARRIAKHEPSLVRTGMIVTSVTLSVTIVCAVVMRVADDESFPTLGKAFWWAAQTATTVGYGDVVPTTAWGRVVAVILMLTGLGFLTVFAGVVASVFVSRVSRVREEDERTRLLAELDARLERLERSLLEAVRHE